MSLTINDLGITQDEIIDRVVERITSDVMRSRVSDEYGDAREVPTPFAQAIEKKLVASIDEAVEKVALKHVVPNVGEVVENHCLQRTNEWGEKRGEPVTFTQYLVARAESYLAEPVDFNGQTKSEYGTHRSGWRGTSTRVVSLIEKHLHYRIKEAMEEALKSANSSITGGIEKAVKVKLSEVASKLKIDVKTK